MYTVTFCEYDTGRQAAADGGGVEMSRDQILQLMGEVLVSPGSYVSVMDREGTMLQFVLDEDGSVMLDIPAPRRRGSFAKRTTLAECEAAVRSLGDRVDTDAFEGLVFERW